MNGRLWTESELEILTRMYPDHFAKEIAVIIGREVSSVYAKARKLGLECSQEKIRRSGLMSSGHPNVIASRFSKGHVPDNKGKRMPPEVYEKVRRTMFKKGHESINRREVGSERVNVDGYVEVKVREPNKWRLKHRVVWEEANGEIPEGYNIQFRNGNRLDCSLGNLYLISRRDQLTTQNSYYARYPKELQEVIRLKGAVKRMIRKRERDVK